MKQFCLKTLKTALLFLSYFESNRPVQFRHPDATSNAYKVFFGVGLIMFLEVMGIFNENAVFWTICLVLYLLVCLVITSIIYHSGLWSLDFLVFLKIYQSVTRLAKTRECSENYSGKRLGLCLSLNALNLGKVKNGLDGQKRDMLPNFHDIMSCRSYHLRRMRAAWHLHLSAHDLHS